MNNQMNAAGAVPRQAPYDEARDQLANEQARSDSLVTDLYSRLNRALDPIGLAVAPHVILCQSAPRFATVCTRLCQYSEGLMNSFKTFLSVSFSDCDNRQIP